MKVNPSQTLPLTLAPCRTSLPEALARFHPFVADWFVATLGAPTACQARTWEALDSGQNVLVAAPTGSGKTLAAFLSALNELVLAAEAGALPPGIRVLYVSPLRALSNDIQLGLERPLAGVNAEAARAGHPPLGIRSGVRTGDTPPERRAAMRRQAPHVLVTTPESLYILLTSASGREQLRQVGTVIVDEIHALAGTKRGDHLALSLARLEALAIQTPRRIGLSATQRPIEAIARLLVGRDPAGAERACQIVDLGHQRPRDLAIELPDEPLSAILSAAGWEQVFDRLQALIAAHQTTLVFVNTRRQAERIAHHLSRRLGEAAVAAHHGSLSREQRLNAEAGLKAGTLKAVVATASLELGIDIGPVDLVCQVGATRRIATFLQRAGRAGHALQGLPKARLLPLSRDDLAECVALLLAVQAGELDAIELQPPALDVLAQQMLAAVAAEAQAPEQLWRCIQQAEPYAALTRAQFDAVVELLVQGYHTPRGRRAAWLAQDALTGELSARRGTRLMAITNGGAIPDTAQWEVRALPEALFIGSLDEDFAIESAVGDVFQLGNSAWRVVRTGNGVVWVEDAGTQPPNIPFWFGESPARSPELSASVWRLRALIQAPWQGRVGAKSEADLAAARQALAAAIALPTGVVTQLVDYYASAHNALGALPTGTCLIAERFFDESGGMQLLLHCPWGSRVNRAYGLALRKRFCRSFNFELQAAATEDAIILSLTEVHSFPLEAIWQFLDPTTLRDVLTQALLDAPLFITRWRWVAVCALALPRMQGGSKVPPRLLRMRAEDLIAAVFPDQLACLENLAGPRRIPDHPLVQQTLQDCLQEAMDLARLTDLITAIRTGGLELRERELPEPSPLAAEILTARPYAFLDDAPAEERRTLAVQTRRYTDPRGARDFAHLDDAAIARVRDEAWPQADTAQELQDVLVSSGLLTPRELAAAGWEALMQELATRGSAVAVALAPGHSVWVALERWQELQSAYAAGWPIPLRLKELKRQPECPDPERARSNLLRDRLSVLGPVTLDSLAAELALAESDLTAALAALEVEGTVLQGRFSAGAVAVEWCDRRLLARIQRYTLGRLRAAIEPVTPAALLHFWRRWQGLDCPRAGQAGVRETLLQLSGWVAPAAAWEERLLAQRVGDYHTELLDRLCRQGEFIWQRVGGERTEARLPVAATPITWVARSERGVWDLAPGRLTDLSEEAAQVLAVFDRAGASFVDELLAALGWPAARLGAALAECVARGVVAADGFAGLRALAAQRSAWTAQALAEGGRWYRVGESPVVADEEAQAQAQARILLRRWGILYPALVRREALALPWRVLLPVLRRFEARGEVRGGRFVQGLSGEQFALDAAVAELRAGREAAAPPYDPDDPLNPGGLVPGYP